MVYLCSLICLRAEVVQKNDSTSLLSVGEFVWAKLGSFPWWPAQITYDPQSGRHLRERNKGPRQYHVRFLDKRLSRAWLFDKSVRGFSVGSDEFRMQHMTSRLRPEFEQAVQTAEKSANDPKAVDYKCADSNLAKEKGRSRIVCYQCDDLGANISCSSCRHGFHTTCLGLTMIPESFKCAECILDRHTCLHCQQLPSIDKRTIRCSVQSCGNYFHLDCVKALPLSSIEGKDRFRCPGHQCSSCMKALKNGGASIRCKQCPLAFHAQCLPPGCQLLGSTNRVICGRHIVSVRHRNSDYCDECGEAGDLVCCDGCPVAFHSTCLERAFPGFRVPDAHWFCHDCQTSPPPSFGDVVLVKFGVYRWWPAVICSVDKIPAVSLRGSCKPSDVPVEFLGSHDFAVVSRARVRRFREDAYKPRKGGSMQSKYNEAMLEAVELFKTKRDDTTVTLVESNGGSQKPSRYLSIKRSVYVPPSLRKKAHDKEGIQPCECTDDKCCSEDDGCLNRDLASECVAGKCPAGIRCQNRRFQKREFAKVEPFRTVNRGWGLRALEPLTKGQFIIEYVGEVIDLQTCAERLAGEYKGLSSFYLLSLTKTLVIDAYPKGNMSRFINHSCCPNCETQQWNVAGEMRVGIFARQDLLAGAELTFDYQFEGLDAQRQRCGCGASNCSGFLGEKPLDARTSTKRQQSTESNVIKNQRARKTATS